MSTPKVVPWKTVRDMLDRCAPGWTSKDLNHLRYVAWKGRDCTVIRLGDHGQRRHQNYEVPSGKVRNLVWVLGIDRDCATTHLGIPIGARP